MDGRWDFAESNMKQIRRWWCLVLLKNFPLPSAEELSGSRKRRREGKKLQDKDICTKRARVAPTASSSEGSAGREMLINPGRQAPSLTAASPTPSRASSPKFRSHLSSTLDPLTSWARDSRRCWKKKNETGTGVGENGSK
ncbi:unnamed protein product [Gadus morhua 'NCC']